MINADDLVGIPLFSDLSAEERQDIAERSADISLRPDDYLLHEGESPYFFVLLEGRIEVHKNDRVIREYKPGDFFGEVPLLLGSPSIASLRAAEASRLLRLEASQFREKIVGDRRMSPLIMTEVEARTRDIQHLELGTPRVTVVGQRMDPECHALRKFLAANQVEFRWLEPEEAVRRWNQPFDDCPVLVGQNDKKLGHPSNLKAAADMVGLHTQPDLTDYDVGIVGAGPAGLAAAVYGASEGLRTLVADKHGPGGQAGTSSRIKNYLGFPDGVSGELLTQKALLQARGFGAEIVVARRIVGLEPAADPRHVLVLDGGERLSCRSVVLATGVLWRRLECPDLDRLEGSGVYYGASRTEALSTRGEDVFLVGGGNSAGQAAMSFADFARRVTLVVRGPSLEADMSSYLIEELKTRDNIRVMPNTELAAVKGGKCLEEIVLRHADTGREETVAARYLFLLIGAVPHTDWLPDAILRDDDGYIITGRDLTQDPSLSFRWPLKSDPYLLETSVPGIFAAGDVRSGSVKRCASAVGEGSMAISFIHQFMSGHKKQDRRVQKAAALLEVGRTVART